MIWWNFLIHDEVRMLRGQEKTCSGSQASPRLGGSHGAHLTAPSAPSCLFPGLPVCAISAWNCHIFSQDPDLQDGKKNAIFIYLLVGLLTFDTSQTRFKGFPGGGRGKERACQCRRCKRPRFDTWVGKIPWRRARQHTPAFLPGEPHGQSLESYSL